MASFLGEIKRRKVFQVAVVYVLVAWVTIQVVDVVAEPLKLPDWLATVVIVFLVAGFPAALVLAWTLDLKLVRTPASEAGDRLARTRAGREPTVDNAREEALPRSVAVLPFDNLSPNPEDSYFAAGIHEEILNHLAKIRGISVIARTSVMQYAGAARPISEIASELKVGTLMEGTVRFAGDRVRVTAQLIEGSSGTHLWTETYDRDLADIFAIQTDIATHIARALRSELSPGEHESLTQRPTDSTEAYALYLRAMALFVESGSLTDPTGMPSIRARIQSYLDRAIELDPEFALAHAWRARLYTSSRQNDPMPLDGWLKRKTELEELIRLHAQRALQLDPDLGLAYSALAYSYFLDLNASEAQEAFKRAVKVSPNDPNTHYFYSLFLVTRDETAEAVRFAERAVELDPNNPECFLALAWAHHRNEDFDRADQAYKEGIAKNPAVPTLHFFKARLDHRLGNNEMAVRGLRTADRLMPAETAPPIRAEVAWAYSQLGQQDDVTRVVAEVEQRVKDRYFDPAARSWVCFALGDYDKAYELLREAIANTAIIQDPWILHYTRQNAWCDPALEETRFKELLSHVWN